MAEPILLLGKQRFSNVDIRIRVKGGGHVSQIYAIRQAIAKALVAFYQKCARLPRPNNCAAKNISAWDWRDCIALPVRLGRLGASSICNAMQRAVHSL